MNAGRGTFFLRYRARRVFYCLSPSFCLLSFVPLSFSLSARHLWYRVFFIA